jgi:hypothetical protein
MWNAPSDRDYYDPHGLDDRDSEEDDYDENEFLDYLSLCATEPA